MTTFDQLCTELDKDPAFRAEYERQAPEYDALLADIKREAMNKPILHIYQDGDQFFAALPDFVDLQESEVAWLERSFGSEIVFIRDGLRKRTETEKDAILARATDGRLAGDGDAARL